MSLSWVEDWEDSALYPGFPQEEYFQRNIELMDSLIEERDLDGLSLLREDLFRVLLTGEGTSDELSLWIYAEYGMCHALSEYAELYGDSNFAIYYKEFAEFWKGCFDGGPEGLLEGLEILLKTLFESESYFDINLRYIVQLWKEIREKVDN